MQARVPQGSSPTRPLKPTNLSVTCIALTGNKAIISDRWSHEHKNQWSEKRLRPSESLTDKRRQAKVHITDRQTEHCLCKPSTILWWNLRQKYYTENPQRKYGRSSEHAPIKIERLSANINPTLHKDLVRSKMTYACPVSEFAHDASCTNKTQGFRANGNFPRRPSVGIWMFLSKFRVCTSLWQNYVDSNQKPCKITKMETFETRDKEKADLWGLNLAVVKPTTVQMAKFPLWHKLSSVRHDLLN